MSPVMVSVWLAGIIAAACLIWSNRHCLKRTALQRLSVGIIGSSALLICVSQSARVTELDALPGKIRAWLWVALLSGVALEMCRIALERKR